MLTECGLCGELRRSSIHKEPTKLRSLYAIGLSSYSDSEETEESYFRGGLARRLAGAHFEPWAGLPDFVDLSGLVALDDLGRCCLMAAA